MRLSNPALDIYGGDENAAGAVPEADTADSADAAPSGTASKEDHAADGAGGDGGGDAAPALPGKSKAGRRASAVFNKVRLAQRVARKSWAEVFQQANEF